jgi:thiamine pyrophosphate-dependent acetolactate synthase large subunit-like protein
MANALPQAIGARVSHPGRQVIALSGDGGVAVLKGELFSLRQLKLPVKSMVFNNSPLAFVELKMKAAGGPDLVPLPATRFCKDVRGAWNHWTQDRDV